VEPLVPSVVIPYILLLLSVIVHSLLGQQDKWKFLSLVVVEEDIVLLHIVAVVVLVEFYTQNLFL
jgi:hypothetical protein